MPATRSGVFHNIRESEYVVSNGEITFFFSSLFLLQKFMAGHKQHRKDFHAKMKKLAKDLPLNTDVLADIHYYEQTEKRGFLVGLKGVEINWQDLHLYACREMTKPNTPVWSKTQKPRLGGLRRITGWM
jgi:hypothetical protein